MSAQPIGEYRGCTIYIYPRDPPVYGNSCTTGLRLTIARVKQDIDAYRDGSPEPPPAPEPPPEPEPDPYQPIGEYRGCILLVWPSYSPVHYSSSCTVTHRYEIDRVKADIDAYRVTHPEPAPPPEEDEWVEFYKAIEIWRRASDGKYYAEVTRYITVEDSTLTGIRAKIDTELELLNPPEEPPDGLFAQVVAEIKVWFLANIPDWVADWGQIVKNFITNVVENITNVYNVVQEYITNVVNNVYESITNVYNVVQEYVTNTYTYVTETITNNITQVHNYVTNIIGLTEETVDEKIVGVATWVQGLFAVLDPHGLLKDPLGYITTAFNVLIAPWGKGIVKSFWEGFEEGQAE